MQLRGFDISPHSTNVASLADPGLNDDFENLM